MNEKPQLRPATPGWVCGVKKKKTIKTTVKTINTARRGNLSNIANISYGSGSWG